MRLFALLGLAGLAATPAIAQDIPEDRPFSGVYVGGTFGYDIQNNDRNSILTFDRNLDGTFGDVVRTGVGVDAFGPGFCNGSARTNIPAQGCRNDKDDIAYYGRVGFDIQRSAVVLGVVGEFGKSEITDSVSAFSSTPASYVLTRKLDWEASARARAGFAANTTLFYVTGGGGYARIDRTFQTTNAANAFELTGKRNHWGFLGGGGLEQKIGRNFSIGMEYMYHQYDNDDDARVRVTRGTAPATNPFISAPNTTGTDIARSDPKFTWHSIRATAGFRF